MKTYIYEGKKVFLAYTHDMSGVEPLERAGDIGCYPVSAYNGCSTCCTMDEEYTGEIDDEDEIVYSECMNCHNEQALAEGWYTKYYAEVDEFQRMLCEKTTRYHRWTSELSRLINYLNDKADNHCIAKWFVDSERESWNKTVEEYRKKISPDNPLDLPDVMTFDEILKQEGITIEEDE